ncbi:MAG: hypothetical protein M3541_05870 [Acidobacteriota bacterium]|nr:hypothetical protein [Acidobacteriota bacterium]
MTYRILRLFSDIRRGEAATAVLMLLNVFLLLVGYYSSRHCGSRWCW